jgi:hypothetical protein
LASPKAELLEGAFGDPVSNLCFLFPTSYPVPNLLLPKKRRFVLTVGFYEKKKGRKGKEGFSEKRERRKGKEGFFFLFFS